MFKKNLITFVILLLFSNNHFAKANDVANMSGISEAAGNSAQAAANQLSEDASKVTANISSATESLGQANSDIGKALDSSIAEAEKAMEFAQESLAAGNITAAVQTMSLVEGVADMALGVVPDPNALDMSGMDFGDFSDAEMAALSSIAGQMGAGKVIAMQKLAGQMNAVGTAGFDAKGMMGNLDGNGIGIGTAMEGLAKAGMVDMESVVGAKTFDIGNFDAGNFASMNVAEMGMSPSMMAGALDALPVGAATAALETLAENPGMMGNMTGVMTGAISASMMSKGMGKEMLGAMGTAMGLDPATMEGMGSGMQGLEGMGEIGKAMGGMKNMTESLAAAFENPEVGITAAMSGTVGMISGAISGKAQSKNAITQGSEKGSFAAGMAEAGPEAIEMPENVSESGMMMGAMVMARPSLAGGLPGAMAPPKGMTAAAMGNVVGSNATSAADMAAMSGMTDVVGGGALGAEEMGKAMAEMTGM